MSNNLTTRKDKMMPIPGMILGIALLLIGLALVLTSSYVGGILLLIIGGAVISGRTGLEVNLNNKMYREFYSFFGIRFGKWQDFKPYPNIIIMNRNIRGNRNVGIVNISSGVESYCDVFLASSNHRKRLLLERCDERKDADFKAAEWALKLDLEYVPYNPQISAASQARRYRR